MISWSSGGGLGGDNISLYPMVRITITGIFFRDIEADEVLYYGSCLPVFMGALLFSQASASMDIRTEGEMNRENECLVRLAIRPG